MLDTLRELPTIQSCLRYEERLDNLGSLITFHADLKAETMDEITTGRHDGQSSITLDLNFG